MLLTGEIGDFGEAVLACANGMVQQHLQLSLAFAHGSFKSSIAGREHKLVSAFGHFPSSTSTCPGCVTVMATTPIVARSGNDAYKEISGSFEMTVTIAELDSWPKCTTADPGALLMEDIFITGSGTVSFG